MSDRATGLVAACLLLLGACADGGSVASVDGSPNRLTASGPESETASPAPRSVIIYLHGAILEGKSGRPAHPRFGRYDHPALVEALGRESADVRSEVRPAEADPNEAAEGVVADVRSLRAAGVPSDRIAVIGFSKGGWIALRANALLADPAVRFVVQGTCTSAIGAWLGAELHGRILSIVEASDSVAGSCADLLSEQGAAIEWDEILIETGLDHGAFYEPREVWLEPTLDWVE